MTGIIFIGPPCSGKSTIAKEISKRLLLPYISSGDIARNMAKHNVDARASLEYGEMAPESMMRENIKNELLKYSHGIFILDGFPRNIDQYIWLQKFDMDIVVVHIDSDTSSILLRSRIRNRDDDKSICTRLNYYIGNTQSLLKYIDKDIIYIDNSNKNINDVIGDVTYRLREEIGC